MSREELRACPFCGQEAELHQEGKNAWGIECMGCHVFLPSDSWYLTKEIAIKAWNTRPQPKQERVEMEEKKLYDYLSANRDKFCEEDNHGNTNIWWNDIAKAICQRFSPPPLKALDVEDIRSMLDGMQGMDNREKAKAIYEYLKERVE